MPSREEVRRAVEARMRRGARRADAQRQAAADLGVPVSEVLSVELFSGDAVTYQDGNYSNGSETT